MNTIRSPKTASSVQEEQLDATVRLVIFGIVFAYVVWYAMDRGDLKIVAFLAPYPAVAIGIFAATRLSPAPNVSRRMLGIVADAAAITGVLFLGSAGAGRRCLSLCHFRQRLSVRKNLPALVSVVMRGRVSDSVQLSAVVVARTDVLPGLADRANRSSLLCLGVL
jgi:hypothetical protein